jgi:hypothetical protein
VFLQRAPATGDAFLQRGGRTVSSVKNLSDSAQVRSADRLEQRVLPTAGELAPRLPNTTTVANQLGANE